MLVDCPIEIGEHRTIGWEQHDLPHRYVVWGIDEVDDDRLVADTRKVIDVCAGMFGGLPYDRYLFILHVVPDGRGGLEHKSSSSLLVTPASLSGDEYEKLISLVAHEFFHVWLGKRIRPEPLGPFDYVAENYTRTLWVVEGFTTYYTEVVLLRAGLITEERFLERIGGMIAQHEALPGRLHQSLEDSSFDAWIKFYRPDAHTPNAQVSYYQKGALVALVLDLEIRWRTGGERSLDDVMALLWERYGVRDVGFPEEREMGIQAIVEEVAGGEMGEIFADYVAGRAEIDFDRYLAAAGLELGEPAGGALRKPGSPGAVPPVHESRLGVRVREDGGRLRVTTVLEGGPAADGGVNAGDEIVAVNAGRLSLADLGKLITGTVIGDDLELTLLRRERLITVTVAVRDALAWRSRIERKNDATEKEAAVRRGWLGS
jgi:predicted metalloprotease with PDZ domain